MAFTQASIVGRVIPAKAQNIRFIAVWIPTYVGMTTLRKCHLGQGYFAEIDSAGALRVM